MNCHEIVLKVYRCNHLTFDVNRAILSRFYINFFVGNLIHKYEQAGFQTVWFASAFKGASGIDQMLTPIDHHFKNHIQWDKVIQTMSEHKSISFQGIVLTGWQR